MDGVRVLMFVFLVPPAVLAGSHSLLVISTFIKGETLFPEFRLTIMLDDITVGYFNFERNIYVPKGLNEEEEEKDDSVIDLKQARVISSSIHADLEDRYLYVKHDLNRTENIHVQQTLVVCELMDNDQPGQMITKNALGGTTVDQLHYHEGKFTYQNNLNVTEQRLKPHLEMYMWHHKILYYPACIRTLRGYLKTRSNQVRRRVKPRVRLLQRRRSVSGWDGITCLATGFYPRHINLTILRDGQPVPDHLTTGGDLLPNGDGTYQMRRNLELREEELKEKHNFTCTVTHLSLDNKLDVHLDIGPGEPIVPIVSSLVVAALVLVSVMVVVICIIRWRKQRDPSMGSYSTPSSSK